MRVVSYFIAMAMLLCVSVSVKSQTTMLHDTLPKQNNVKPIADSLKSTFVKSITDVRNDSLKSKIGLDTINKMTLVILKTAKDQKDSLRKEIQAQYKKTIAGADTTIHKLQAQADSVRREIKKMPGAILNNAKGQVNGKLSSIRSFSGQATGNSNDSGSNRSILQPKFYLQHLGKPYIKFNSGRIDYNFYYRSNIDTPFIEQDVYQHQINGTIHATVGKVLPIIVNTQIRRSNSVLFRNITEVQVQYDVATFQKGIYSNALSGLSQRAESLKDFQTEKLSELEALRYTNANSLFQSKFTVQQYVEANELLNVPSLTMDNSLPDSLRKKKSDSLRQNATAYINEYNEQKTKLEKIQRSVDSLKKIYDESVTRVRNIQSLANGKINNYNQLTELEQDPKIKQSGLEVIPDKYKWLLGIRQFSLGRSPVNYSELTAKNISLNGVNFEYNSWYYVSLTAGLIDFRFRDYVINNSKHPKQYFYMARLGVGNIDKNYVIFSVFKGKKQVFASGSINAPYSFYATGATLEARYRFTKNIYVKGEIAESLAPDFRTNPTKYNKWNISDKNDKAYAFSAHIILPRSKTKIDGTYKYSGANYQSFSSFQTNSSFIAWSLKADQYLFKHVIKISAAIKKNEFSNPYLIQDYKSNTVFKSFQVYFRKKRWPIISVAYMPMSQLTNINGTIYENRFNSLTGTISHFYKVAEVKANTTLMFSKFYNTSADSGFIYFNAKNIFFSHTFFFADYTSTTNVTHSTNKNYVYDIGEEVFKIPVRKFAVLSAGVKVSSLNHRYTAVGGSCSLQLSFKQSNTISFIYDNGYIPGVHGTLVRNIMGSIQLSKQF